jgi:esterase
VNLAALEANFESILGFPDFPPGTSFPKPTLFLAGGKSAYLRPEHRAEVMRLFPAATIEVIEHAGHWVHADAPEAFAAAVHRFVDA